jgi:V8-like Glu-specific endopeptidase
MITGAKRAAAVHSPKRAQHSSGGKVTEFKIHGRVTEEESGLGVANLRVRAYDKDFVFDDLLGCTDTDAVGDFSIHYTRKDFRELFEGEPDVYLAVQTPHRTELVRTDGCVRWAASAGESFDIAIARDVLGDWSPNGANAAPILERAVAEHFDFAASEDPPKGARVEVARVWLAEGETIDPTIVRMEGLNAVSIEVPFSLHNTEPPHPEVQALSLDDIKGLDVEEHSAGVRVKHLELKHRPTLVEHLPRAIRRGEDNPNSVFAPDARYVFNDLSFPWATTGRVLTAAGQGSGCMIGCRLILTASHVCNWTNPGVGWLIFTPGYYNGSSPFGTANGTRVMYWNQAQGGLSDFETAFDYAVWGLDRPLGDLTGYPGYRAYSQAWNRGRYWQQIGYPGDLGNGQRPPFFGGGAITSIGTKSTSGETGYVMGHFIDTFGGQSGGPY